MTFQTIDDRKIILYTEDDFKTKSDIVSFWRKHNSGESHYICNGHCLYDHDDDGINCVHYGKVWKKMTEIISPTEMDRMLKLGVFKFKDYDVAYIRMYYNKYSNHSEKI